MKNKFTRELGRHWQDKAYLGTIRLQKVYLIRNLFPEHKKNIRNSVRNINSLLKSEQKICADILLNKASQHTVTFHSYVSTQEKWKQMPIQARKGTLASFVTVKVCGVIQIFISRWIENKSWLHLFNGILLSIKINGLMMHSTADKFRKNLHWIKGAGTKRTQCMVPYLQKA